jgi:hypothetical protein
MSFKINDKGFQEEGKRYWFSKLEDAESYLDNAGKPVPDVKNCYYDDPFEYRWKFAVIEKVYEGPGSHNEIIAWYKANYDSSCRLVVENLQQILLKRIMKISK